MRIRLTCLTLAVLCSTFATSAHAYEEGDFAPRNSLLYARVADMSAALNKLGGDSWRDHVERMLLVRDERDVEQSEAMVDQVRLLEPYFGKVEFAIGDVMIREPFIQSSTIIQLKEGAPTEFSDEFFEFLKEEADDDFEVTKTRFSGEGVTVMLESNLLMIITGGMMEMHAQDVIDGFNDESLSKVKRFTDWSSKAKGDIVAFADMKAWRAAIDRLGEDFDDDVRNALEFIEWQKWDRITASVTLPGKTSALSADVAVYLNQPFERINAFLKPAGGSRLVDVLPSETLGFLSMQLGRDHKQTYADILGFFHDVDQDNRPRQMKRRIRWLENEIRWIEEELEELDASGEEEDKDGVGNPEPQSGARKAEPRPVETDDEYDPEERRRELEAQIADLKARIAEMNEEMAGFEQRPFEAERENRRGDRTDAERFYDEFNEMLEEVGLTQDDLANALGEEALAGILGLPDPYPRENDLDAFEDMWFVIAETTEGFPKVKEKLLDRILGRALPEGASEEDIERAKRQAEDMLFQEVEGGELLKEKGLRSDFCAFAGEGFFGFAANEDVARLILKSSVGTSRFDASKVPGAIVSGSKFAYANLRDILQRLVMGEFNRDREDARLPRPHFDLQKYLPGGAHIAVSSDESSHALLFSVRMGGIGDASPVLEMVADELRVEKQYDHDRDTLDEMERALSNWLNNNRDGLAEMEASERARTLKAVTPESLLEDGLFSPQDGMRSAFDPAMAERLEAMMASYTEKLGPAEGVDSDATDLSESGYEWFGLTGDMGVPGEDDDYRRKFGTWGRGDHVVMATRGDWVRGGRFVVVLSGSRFNWRWMAGEDYTAMREAAATGEPYAGPRLEGDKLPKWKARKLLSRKSREMDAAAHHVSLFREIAKMAGKDAKFNFDGSEHDNPAEVLRELLSLGEDDWFWFEDAKNLKIETGTDGKVTLRFEKWGHWIELTETDEGEWGGFTTTTSLDDQ